MHTVKLDNNPMTSLPYDVFMNTSLEFVSLPNLSPSGFPDIANVPRLALVNDPLLLVNIYHGIKELTFFALSSSELTQFSYYFPGKY